MRDVFNTLPKEVIDKQVAFDMLRTQSRAGVCLHLLKLTLNLVVKKTVVYDKTHPIRMGVIKLLDSTLSVHANEAVKLLIAFEILHFIHDNNLSSSIERIQSLPGKYTFHVPILPEDPPLTIAKRSGLDLRNILPGPRLRSGAK